MKRTEAVEALARAVAEAWRAGASPMDVQDAVEHGCRDANRMDRADLAAAGFLRRSSEGKR